MSRVIYDCGCPCHKDDERCAECCDARYLIELVKRLVAPHENTCIIDHNGFCQEHYFDAPCPVPTARELLASVDSEGDERA